MDPLTTDEFAGQFAAKAREAALDGRERDDDVRDRAADRRDGIAAVRDVVLDGGELPSKASWLRPTVAIDSQKSATAERRNATEPPRGDPSLPRRSTRRAAPPGEGRICSCWRWA